MFGVLIVGGLFLLTVDFYPLRGMLFTGLSKHLLSVRLFFMAGFVGIITFGWVNDRIPKPPASSFRFDPSYVHPNYKGEMILRYWYILILALLCFVFAFALT